MARYWKEKSQALFDQALKAATEMLVPEEAEKAKTYLIELQKELGPVIEAYPTWHPLVRYDGNPDRLIEDHVHMIYFANGYVVTSKEKRWLTIFDCAVNHMPMMADAWVSLEEGDPSIKLFGYETSFIVVKCHWMRKSLPDGTLPPSTAVTNALLTQLFPSLMFEMGKSWDSMSDEFFGLPHDKRDSAWLNKQTGDALKTLWETMLETKVLEQGKGYPDGRTFYPATPRKQ